MHPAEPPPPRHPGRYEIAVVCLGNICRSPMAGVVLAARVDDAGLAGRVVVRSGGTGHWHVGEPMDPRAAATLEAEGLDASEHRARQVSADWLTDADLVLAMDATNLADLRALAAAAAADDPGHAGGAGDPARLRLFRDFDPLGRGEVPDPYYGGVDGFSEVLAMVERTAVAIVAALQREPGLR